MKFRVLRRICAIRVGIAFVVMAANPARLFGQAMDATQFRICLSLCLVPLSPRQAVSTYQNSRLRYRPANSTANLILFRPATIRCSSLLIIRRRS